MGICASIGVVAKTTYSVPTATENVHLDVHLGGWDQGVNMVSDKVPKMNPDCWI